MSAEPLNLSPLSRFRDRVVAYIRTFAEEKLPQRGGQFQMESAERQRAALGSFADFIKGVPKDDPRIFQLSLASHFRAGAEAWKADETFEPSERQLRILFSLGQSPGQAGPEAVFLDFISAGIRDALVEHGKRYGDMSRAVEAAEAAQAAAERRADELAGVEAEADRLRGELEASRAEVAELTDTRKTLEAFLTAGDSGSRRKAIAGETGIYETLRGGRLGLEIGYADSEQKQRWRRLPAGTSIEDARALRKQLAGQPHDPERDGDVDEDAAAEASQDAGDGDGDQPTKPEPVAAGKGD